MDQVEGYFRAVVNLEQNGSEVAGVRYFLMEGGVYNEAKWAEKLLERATKAGLVDWMKKRNPPVVLDIHTICDFFKVEHGIPNI